MPHEGPGTLEESRRILPRKIRQKYPREYPGAETRITRARIGLDQTERLATPVPSYEGRDSPNSLNCPADMPYCFILTCRVL